MSDKTVTVLPESEEKPIAELPPRERMGAIIKRARQRAKLSIAEAVKAINNHFPTDGHYTDMISELALSDIENGLHPISQGQIVAASEVLGVHLYAPLLEAAQAWTREVWKEPKPLTLEVESVRMRRAPIQNDRDELMAVIGLARSTMDAAALLMTQCANRLLHGSMLDVGGGRGDHENLEAMVESVNGLVDVWGKLADRVEGRVPADE